MNPERKRFSVSLEFSLYDNQGGGICGGSARPGFRVDCEVLSPELLAKAISVANEMINGAFDQAIANAKHIDDIKEVAAGF